MNKKIILFWRFPIFSVDLKPRNLYIDLKLDCEQIIVELQIDLRVISQLTQTIQKDQCPLFRMLICFVGCNKNQSIGKHQIKALVA